MQVGSGRVKTAWLMGLGSVIAFTAGCGLSKGPSASSQSAANTYAYVLENNAGSYSIAPLQISNSGTLTALMPASVNVPYAGSLAADPSGASLFAAGQQNNLLPVVIDQFVVGSDGTLTPNAIPTITGGNGQGPLYFTPNGRFALVTNGGDNTVTSYSLNASGELTPVNTVPAGISPYLAAVDATGRFAVVAASESSAFGAPALISEYSISQDGTLTLLVNFEMARWPIAMVVSPKGFLYYVETASYPSGSGSIVVFSVNQTTGGVSVLSSTATSDNTPGWISFDPTASFAYVWQLPIRYGVSVYRRCKHRVSDEAWCRFRD